VLKNILKEIILTIDEYEVLRLKDIEDISEKIARNNN